jgi:hypothetical protein
MTEERNTMTEEIADYDPDEWIALEPCWYCGAAEMGAECSSMVCHDEGWWWR